MVSPDRGRTYKHCFVVQELHYCIWLWCPSGFNSCIHPIFFNICISGLQTPAHGWIRCPLSLALAWVALSVPPGKLWKGSLWPTLWSYTPQGSLWPTGCEVCWCSRTWKHAGCEEPWGLWLGLSEQPQWNGNAVCVGEDVPLQQQSPVWRPLSYIKPLKEVIKCY